MATKVPNVKLSNGKEIPILGLGTWKSQPNQVLEAIKTAIDIGYRHIDCAHIYQNEVEVGQALKAKIDAKTIKREDLFITSKLWNTYHKRVMECCKKSLNDLGLDYLDLYLVHWPMAFKEGDDLIPTDENGQVIAADSDHLEIWKGMEECYEKGLVRSIGLSNFNSRQIQHILDNCKVKPVMLQVESHPYLPQTNLIDFCSINGITVTAYSPLGSPDRPDGSPDDPVLLEDPIVKKMAIKYDKTVAQILLKFQVQCGVVVIPKSVNEERLRQNFALFDFELASKDMTALIHIKQRHRYCDWPGMQTHSNYPFHPE